MLYTGNTSTITVAIYSETIRGSYHTAAALATILMVTMVIALAIFMKATKGKGSVV
jgi:iron(III) transport system permease protein